MVTRLDHDLVSRWNNQLPNALRSKALIQRQAELQSLIEEHGIHLDHVKAAETTQRKLQNIPNWKVSLKYKEVDFKVQFRWLKPVQWSWHMTWRLILRKKSCRKL